MQGFQSYKDYVYLKRHFKDYKFNWTCYKQFQSLKESTFAKRKDRSFFQRFETKVQSRDERVEHLISLFLVNNESWVGDLFNESHIQYHKDRMKRVNHLGSLVQSELEKIEFFCHESHQSFKDILLTFSIECPILIQEIKTIGLSMETISILSKMTQFLESWFPINPLLKLRRLQYLKYQTLLTLTDQEIQHIKNQINKLAQTSASHIEH